MYTQNKLLDLVEGKEKMPEAAELKGAWMKRSFDAYMLMSWSALAFNLNSQQPQWSVDYIRARILEEDLWRRSVERSEEGAGYGVGGGKSGFKKNWKGKNKDNPKEDGGGGQGEVRFYCKKRGHRWRKCYQRPKDWTPLSSSNQHGGKRSGGVMGADGEEKDEEKGGKSEERKAEFFFFVNGGATDLAMAAKPVAHALPAASARCRRATRCFCPSPTRYPQLHPAARAISAAAARRPSRHTAARRQIPATRTLSAARRQVPACPPVNFATAVKGVVGVAGEAAATPLHAPDRPRAAPRTPPVARTPPAPHTPPAARAPPASRTLPVARTPSAPCTTSVPPSARPSAPRTCTQTAVLPQIPPPPHRQLPPHPHLQLRFQREGEEPLSCPVLPVLLRCPRVAPFCPCCPVQPVSCPALPVLPRSARVAPFSPCRAPFSPCSAPFSPCSAPFCPCSAPSARVAPFIPCPAPFNPCSAPFCPFCLVQPVFCPVLPVLPCSAGAALFCSFVPYTCCPYPLVPHPCCQFSLVPHPVCAARSRAARHPRVAQLTSDHSGGGEQQGAGPAVEEGLEDELARVDLSTQPEPAANAKVTKRSVQRGASPHGQQSATREKRVAAAPSRLKYSRLGGPKQGAMAVQADEGEDEEMAFYFFTPLPGEPATMDEALSGPQKEEWKAAMCQNPNH
ncbi:unnamed protein product [Closterium sp. NIES-65]|nr:unnamed protein product [Closterium sp. NIES-65]